MEHPVLQATATDKPLSFIHPTGQHVGQSASPLAIISALTMATGFTIWMIKPVGDIKLVILGYVLVLLSCGINILTDGIWIDKLGSCLWLGTFIVSGVSALIGTSRNNIGASSELIFFLILPSIWFIISWGAQFTLSSFSPISCRS